MKKLIVCKSGQKSAKSRVIDSSKQLRITKHCAYKYSSQANAGFSLVEVIAVTLMVGILATIAIPSWNAFINRQRVGKANDAVLAVLQKAQQEAKNKKLKYSVSLKNSNNLPELAFHPDSDTPDFSKDKTFSDLGLKTGQISIGSNLNNPNQGTSTVSAITTTVKEITFDNNGTLPVDATVPIKIVVASSPSNITQTNGLKRCVIIETLLGGIRSARDSACN
ncbi:prepilin-type N-terminal cleavage/methylation domain-containing protein [Nostoc sp. PCC 7107]|uniref:prepilin-type N-terminal cleavage/methylation domain-containing protein n=1 Tax=Nostoc sp. PCC 7107 TaxID=317936 RepID=UPI00029ECE3D|nr:prepilin-type N-terminal cleavage/methylation domain-containing protein [Nostoc sp. PCC 7107]AFY40748.1 hypothetical protein Nos7107_0056 [Nostoc sp. PCC 7107]